MSKIINAIVNIINDMFYTKNQLRHKPDGLFACVPLVTPPSAGLR